MVVAELPELETAELGHGPKTVSFRAAPDHAVPEGRGPCCAACGIQIYWDGKILQIDEGNESLCDEHDVEFFLLSDMREPVEDKSAKITCISTGRIISIFVDKMTAAISLGERSFKDKSVFDSSRIQGVKISQELLLQF